MAAGGLILVDTSAWVEYYRPGGAESARTAVLEAILSDRAAVCGMVRVEFLGYVRDPAAFRTLSDDFDGFRALDTGPADWDRAVALGRDLRAAGVTVPAADLVIAAVALRHRATLLHRDRHFEAIARVAGLPERYLG